MLEKLKSRKFWVMVLGALLPLLAQAIDGSIGWDKAVGGAIAMLITYVAGQSFADGKAVEGRTDLTSQGGPQLPSGPEPSPPPAKP